jgi:hypothetical protein
MDLVFVSFGLVLRVFLSVGFGFIWFNFGLCCGFGICFEYGFVFLWFQYRFWFRMWFGLRLGKFYLFLSFFISV